MLAKESKLVLVELGSEQLILSVSFILAAEMSCALLVAVKQAGDVTGRAHVQPLGNPSQGRRGFAPRARDNSGT